MGCGVWLDRFVSLGAMLCYAMSIGYAPNISACSMCAPNYTETQHALTCTNRLLSIQCRCVSTKRIAHRPNAVLVFAALCCISRQFSTWPHNSRLEVHLCMFVCVCVCSCTRVRTPRGHLYSSLSVARFDLLNMARMARERARAVYIARFT